jgi:DNA-binding transcriptional LysR family regulator
LEIILSLPLIHFSDENRHPWRDPAKFGIHVATASHPELVSVPLLEDHFVLICRDDHPAAGHDALAWNELEGQALIFAGQVNGNRPMLVSLLSGGAMDGVR